MWLSSVHGPALVTLAEASMDPEHYRCRSAVFPIIVRATEPGSGNLYEFDYLN